MKTNPFIGILERDRGLQILQKQRRIDTVHRRRNNYTFLSLSVVNRGMLSLFYCGFSPSRLCVR